MRFETGHARVVAVSMFVVGTALCGHWTYVRLAPSMTFLRQDAGSGGIGAVGVGVLPLELLLLLSPVLTFALTTKGTGALGLKLRWTHVIVTIGLIAIALASAIRLNVALAFVTMDLLSPVQVFFLVAAIALRLSRAGAGTEVPSRDGGP
jgi:hypothetical protein